MAGHGSNQTVNKDMNREHGRCYVSGPLEIFQEGREDDREGIAGTITECIGEYTCSNYKPSIEKELFFLHLNLKSSFLSVRSSQQNITKNGDYSTLISAFQRAFYPVLTPKTNSPNVSSMSMWAVSINIKVKEDRYGKIIRPCLYLS